MKCTSSAWELIPEYNPANPSHRDIKNTIQQTLFSAYLLLLAVLVVWFGL